MLTYTLRRVLALVPTLLAVSFLVFLLTHFIPGDPVRVMAGPEASEAQVAELRSKLGLDRPMLVQYGRYLVGIAQGDLGKSLFLGDSVSSLIYPRLPATIELAVVSLAVSLIAAIPLGVVAATRRHSVVDMASSTLAVAGVATPVFWSGLVLLYLLGVELRLFPIAGRGGPLWTWAGWRHIILPATTLGINLVASTTRLTRASMLEVLNLDFVRTARAKGLSQRAVFYRHALRNALVPVVTHIGLQFGTLLGGVVLTETVFAWPGIGRLAIQAIERRDYPVVQGVILLIAIGFVMANTIVDFLYGVLNPRIRYA